MISSSSSSAAQGLVRHVRPKTNTSSSYVPTELTELILSKCPAKSVMRFKSVSRSWQSIICNPRFATSHGRENRNRNRNRYIIFSKEDDEVLGAHIYVVKLEEEEEEFIFNPTSKLDPDPLYINNGIFRTEWVLQYPWPASCFNIPLCSCDGLFLLTRNANISAQHDYMYMLWNPSIRTHIIITVPVPVPPRLWLHHNLYYDATADDYKIVLSDQYCYALYSCKRGSWSEIKDFPRDLYSSNHGVAAVCVDGCFYNINRSAGSGNGNEIMCFDTRDGNVHKLGQPDEVKRAVALAVVSGRLHFIGYAKDGEGDRYGWWAMERRHGSCFGKWVMENNCVFHRKLIGMDNHKVTDLYLRHHLTHAVSSLHTYGSPNKSSLISLDPSRESRIFPYSENLRF